MTSNRARRAALRPASLALAAAALALATAAPATVPVVPAQVLESDEAGSLFGWSVAPAGDVDGDGRADLIVGAPNYSNGEEREGAVFIYLGASEGFVASPAYQLESDHADATFGWSVAGAGDVDGDGLAEVIVGAPGYSNGQHHEGRVYVFWSATDYTTWWAYESDQAEAHLGHAVAGSVVHDMPASSFNGDAYADVVAAALDWVSGGASVGVVHVFHGGPTGLPAAPSWSSVGTQEGAQYGYSIESVGDVNGDGKLDLGVGTMRFDGLDGADSGLIQVFQGSASGLPASPSWELEGPQAAFFLGGSVGGAGDLDLDGYEDLMASAWSEVQGDDVRGGVSFYLGSETGLPVEASTDTYLPQTESQFGWAVAAVGHFDADPRPEVGMAGTLWDESTTERDVGRLIVSQLSVSNGNVEPKVSGVGELVEGLYGHSVAGVGEVTGNYDDLVVGAPWYTNGQGHEGGVYLYFGQASFSGGS
jgi:hypothetical protein